jgi:hypothetical protein
MVFFKNDFADEDFSAFYLHLKEDFKSCFHSKKPQKSALKIHVMLLLNFKEATYGFKKYFQPGFNPKT